MNTPEKRTFIHYEIWILVFGGAFQRANIYKEGIAEFERNNFRKALRLYVSNDIIPQYVAAISEEQHLKNMKLIEAFSEKYHSILRHGKLNLGVSQKILNLVLKYYWCLGEISIPPHFPVDRIIQDKLNNGKIINWTTLTQEEDYLSIAEAAKLKVDHGQSLAEWELNNFNRR